MGGNESKTKVASSADKDLTQVLNKAKGDTKKDIESSPPISIAKEQKNRFVTMGEEKVTSSTVNENALVGRELEWAKNTDDQWKNHADINGPIIRTRFPPEPNGKTISKYFFKHNIF